MPELDVEIEQVEIGQVEIGQVEIEQVEIEQEGQMFTGFMMNAWTIGTIVAVVGGVVGFFVVLRGSAFPAHAIPKGAFAGAAGANLVGLNTLSALRCSRSSPRSASDRSDVAVATTSSPRSRSS